MTSSEQSITRRLAHFLQHPNALARLAAYTILLIALILAEIRFGSWLIVRLPASVQLFLVGDYAFAIAEAEMACSALVAIWLAVRFLDRRPLASAGFARAGSVSESLIGLLIGAGLVCLFVGIMLLLGRYGIVGQNIGYSFLVNAALFFFVAIAEESIFRGYVLQTIESRWGTKVAVVVSSVLFGLYHVWHVKVWDIATLLRLASTGIMGLLFASAYLARRRLWLPIGLHLGYNLAWSVFSVNVFGGTAALIVSVIPGFLTGGAYGAAVSPVLLVMIVAAARALFLYAARFHNAKPSWLATESAGSAGRTSG